MSPYCAEGRSIVKLRVNLSVVEMGSLLYLRFMSEQIRILTSIACYAVKTILRGATATHLCILATMPVLFFLRLNS